MENDLIHCHKCKKKTNIGPKILQINTELFRIAS